MPMTPTMPQVKACLWLQIPFALPLPSIAADKAQVDAGSPEWGDTSDTSNWMCPMLIAQNSVYCIGIQ